MQPEADDSADAPLVQNVALPILPLPGRFAHPAEKLYRSAVMSMLSGDDAAAIKAFGEIVRRDPTVVSAHILAATRPSIDPAAAIRHLEALVASPHRLPDRLQAKYLPSGLGTAGVRITDNLEVALPLDAVGIELLRAAMYKGAGRVQDAVGVVKRLHAERPTHPDILLSLADLLLLQRDFEGVLGITDRIGNQDDRGVATLHIRAVALYALGRRAAALAAFRSALTHVVDRDPALLMAVRYDRALALREFGRTAAARKDLERIAAADPAYRDIQDLLAAWAPRART